MSKHPIARVCLAAVLVFGSLAPLAPAGASDDDADTGENGAARGWVEQLGGGNRDFASAITVTGDRAENAGPAIAGRFRGQVELGGTGGGGASDRLAAAGLTDGFAAQLDGDGSLRWAVRLGGRGADEAKAVAPAPGGGLYVAGFFSDTVRLAPGVILTSAGSSDAFLARLSADGSVLWARAFGGPLGDVALAVASAGNSVAVAGYFQGRADLDPGPARVEHASAGRRDAFLVVLDAEGEARWSRRLGGAGNDEAAAVSALDDGWAVAGRFEQTAASGRSSSVADDAGGVLRSAGGRDAFVASFDRAGTPRWSRRAGGPGRDDATVLAVLPPAADGGDATLLVAGGFEGELEVGAEIAPLTSAGDRDIYLLALAAGDGTPRFASRFGGPGGDYATGVTAGGGDRTFDIAGFSLGQAGTGGDDPPRTRSFVHRLRPPAEAVWSRELEADWGIQILGLARGPDGVPYLAGSFKGAARFELGGGDDVNLAGSAKIDAFVAALVP